MKIMRTSVNQENNFNERINYYPHNVWQSFTFMGLYILIIAIIYLLFTLLGYKERMHTESMNAVIFCISSFILIFFIKLRNRLKGFNTQWEVSFSGLKLLPIFLVIIFILQFGILKPVLDKLSLGLNENISKNPFESSFHIFSVLILAPVLEEIIFRGIILKGFLLTYPAKKAIILSTLLFALVHFNVAHFEMARIIAPLCVGMFLGWIYFKINNLALCIFIHSISNLFGLMVLYLTYFNHQGDYELRVYYNEFLQLGVFFISLIFIFFLLRYLNKRIDLLELIR